MNNEETLATLGPQYTERWLKQSTHKNTHTTQYVLGTIMGKQTQIMYIRYEPSHKQLKLKKKNVLCGNRN